jgi:hypothetical protein
MCGLEHVGHVNTGSNGTTGQVRRVLGALLVGLIRKWILLPGNGEATLAATTHTSLPAVRPMTTKPPEVINSHDGG